MASRRTSSLTGCVSPSCEPRRELFEGHGPESMPPVPGRFKPKLPHLEAAVGDDCSSS